MSLEGEEEPEVARHVRDARRVVDHFERKFLKLLFLCFTDSVLIWNICKLHFTDITELNDFLTE